MDTLKISIITINYNNFKGLEKTIASVKKQSYSNIEYIVIDGNSNDGSKEVLKKENKNISISISEPDRGIFNAMNKGIKKASGDFLLFLNSGDVFTSNVVLFDFINHQKFQGDIIYGNYDFENGKKEYPDLLTPQYFMRSSLPHQSTLIAKDVFDKIGFYNENYKIIGDRAHFFRAYLSDQFQFTHVPIALALYDLTGISNTPKYQKLKQEEDVRMFKKYFGLFYEDYIELFELKKRLKFVESRTLRGFCKRILKKVKRIWKSH